MDKKLLLAVGLSFLTVWGLQYYTGSKQPVEQGGAVSVNTSTVAITPGQPVKVPTAQDLYKPLNLTIDFVDQKMQAEEVVSVETTHCHAVFSSYGAVLESLDFKDYNGKQRTPLRTIHKKGSFKAIKKI